MTTHPPDDEPADWPIASMLLLGTFGKRHSLASARYHRHCWIALSVLVVGTLATVVVRPALGRQVTNWISAALLSGSFGFIALSMWRYVEALDELSRRLQLEAMAITYLVGMAVFMTLSGLRIAVPFETSPILFLGLELVRGVALVAVAKKYR